MSTSFEILCPWHNNTEMIQIPTSYSDDFSGQIPCSYNGGHPHILPAPIEIAIKNGKVASVKRFYEPKRENYKGGEAFYD